MRCGLVLLAAMGIVVSALALREHYRMDTSPCSINDKWDCGIVNHSPYAVLWNVPVATIGIAGYLLLAALSLGRAGLHSALGYCSPEEFERMAEHANSAAELRSASMEFFQPR